MGWDLTFGYLFLKRCGRQDGQARDRTLFLWHLGQRPRIVKSRKEYLLVAAKDVERMRSQPGMANVAKENLRKNVNELVREKRRPSESLKRAKGSAYSRSLRSKLEGLEQQVEYLREERGRLEEHLARAG